MINFNINAEKWNLISEKGYPKDGEWCFIIYKVDNKWNWSVGAYSTEKEQFYVDFGFGGVVVEKNSVYAWCVFDNDDYLTINEK